VCGLLWSCSLGDEIPLSLLPHMVDLKVPMSVAAADSLGMSCQSIKKWFSCSTPHIPS
jgi:hypothetical protein